MSKKALSLFGCMLVANMALAANTLLPFIGTRDFNFDGGSSTGQSITIQKNGMATIKWYGDAETMIIYHGKYQEYMPIKFYADKKFYKIANGEQILRLNKNKKL